MSTNLDALQVLVIEDDVRYQSRAEALVRSRVPDAMIELAAEYKTALPQVLNSYYDVLILDLVLHPPPNGPQESWEGLWILQEIFERGLHEDIAIFILTGYGNVAVSTHIFVNYRVLDFWEKGVPDEDHSLSFQRAIDRTAGFDLQREVIFEAGLTWRSLVEALGIQFWRISADVTQTVAELELRHLIRRLFPGSSRVAIAPLAKGDKGVSGAGLVLATPMGDDGSRMAEVVVKYGALDQINSEIRGWRELRPFMRGQRFTQLQHAARGRKLGAIAYSFVGVGQIRSFSAFYGAASVTDVTRVLTNLFQQTCGLWYETANCQDATLSFEDEYQGYLGFSPERVKQALKSRYPENPIEAKTVDFSGIPRKFAHPIAAYAGGELRLAISSQKCRTHGDLHTGNIFVDEAVRDAWLIDFYRSGLGHWARDFVELEASLKFQHLPSRDLKTFFELENQLLRMNSLDEVLEFQDTEEPEFYKGARAIECIRHEAARVPAGAKSALRMLDYNLALFFQTINYIRLYRLIDSPVKKNKVLLSSAMIYEKIAPQLRAMR